MPRPTAKKVAAQAPAEETPQAVSAPATRSKMAVRNTSFNLFEASEQKAQLVKEGKFADAFKSAAEVNRDYLPVPWLAFQYLIGRIGVPVNTIFEIMGPDNTGKSSLLVDLLGNFIRYNIPCFYINTEPKMLESDWMTRLFGKDASMGEKIKRALEISEQCYTLDEMDAMVRNWIKVQRHERNIPKDVPLVVAIDTISKLQNPEEAKASFDEKSKKLSLDKGIVDISEKPGVTASWLHKWARAIIPILNEENVTLFAVSCQNMKMATGPAALGGGDSLNRTRPGGLAMNQIAAFQVTITKVGAIKNTAGDTIGYNVRARMVKNSYGPCRDIIYILRNDAFKDTKESVQQAIDMSEVVGGLLVKKAYFGLKCERKKYTSEELGVFSVSAQELQEKIDRDPALTYKVATKLDISGYEALGSQTV